MVHRSRICNFDTSSQLGPFSLKRMSNKLPLSMFHQVVDSTHRWSSTLASPNV